MEIKDTLALTISGFALFVAISSVLLNLRQWRLLHRPVVLVRLINPKAGNRGTPFELEVLNVGNRPALDVRMKVEEAALRRALDPSSKFPPDDIEACFKESAGIGFLTAGQSIVSSFGYNGAEAGEQIWIIGSALPIVVRYRDLQGNAFETKGTLTITTKNGFSGYTWSDPK